MQSSITNHNAIVSRKIVAEISIALKDIGADLKLLDKLKTWPVDKIYSAAEDMAAPAMLLAFVGSWGDTLTDEECCRSCKEPRIRRAKKLKFVTSALRVRLRIIVMSGCSEVGLSAQPRLAGC
jgi:hypothetical protein